MKASSRLRSFIVFYSKCVDFNPSTRTVFTSSLLGSEKKDAATFDNEFLAEIEKKIIRNRQILRRHSLSHIKARELSSSIANLNISMNNAQQKRREAFESPANSREWIMSFTSVRRDSDSVENVPIQLSRGRFTISSATAHEVTQSTWDNIAGISSILLSKETNCLPTRLHGAMNVKHFLECIRPFQDSDYGSTKYPSQVEERPYTLESYEDAALRVTYLPLSAPLHDSDSKADSLNVAYLIELKTPPRRIDPLKLIAHKVAYSTLFFASRHLLQCWQVPKGPLIGKLKNGDTVELPDGRKIRPTDVFSDEAPKEEKSRALVFECSGEAHIKALYENSVLQDFMTGSSHIDYAVHLSDQSVIQLPSYAKFVASLGEKCSHVVVNESCPFVPGIESIFRNHRLLNKICPDLFPQLHPLGWTGLVTQGSELAVHDGVYIKAAPLQRFWMRMGEARQLRASSSSEGEYPRVSFLGTSSAVHPNTEHVSSYLLEASSLSAILVDVGEGTYGQLRVLLGNQGCSEILGNGSCHLRQCVAIRTPLKTYLFNCPEGASRFLPQLRMKSLNVNDIFITRSTWDNIAGISSILLSKETNCLPTRLHGAMNVKHFLECIRPFQDSDYGSTKYPSQVEERPYTLESYEDAALRVTYLPLSAPLHDSDSKADSLNVAYLIELKTPPRRIDPLKLIAHKVPKGPLIGKLKNGDTVELPDGRKIRPTDVFSDEAPKEEKSRALVFECSGEAHIKALYENSVLQDFMAGSSHIDYAVHLSDQSVIQLPSYAKFVASLGEKCSHVVVNESCPFVPGIESIFRNHRLLNKICPDLFPQLHPLGWTGLVTQGSELAVHDGVYIKAAPLQRFWMRMGGNGEEPIIADLRDTASNFTDAAQKLIGDLHEEARQLRASSSSEGEYPRVSFLGTSSAVPSKYRNVSSYLLEASSSSAILVDVGEGTYGQLRVLLGNQGCSELLCKLNAVFITHAHQDHMNGLYTIIERRKEAIEGAGGQYTPLVLVCNRNVLKPLKTYSMCFSDLESLVEIVDISRHPITPPARCSYMLSPGLRVPIVQARGKVADSVIHEATFEDGHEADALRKKHSTMGQAVEIGRKMKARNVILTHFSARYPKVPELPAYLEKCGNVGVAMDNLSVRFDHLALVPKLIPIFREVYQEELFEIELRKESRNFKQKEERESKQKSELKARENTVAN
ncbi:metallo-beta-lactamase domain protein [Ostertagia ostertagi]